MAKANPTGVYAAAHFGLELDGKEEVSLFRSIEGGGVRADVMTYQPAAHKEIGYNRFRLVGKPKFEDIKLQVGMSMSGPFYSWIANFFNGVADRRNGAILAADFYYKERARRTFKAGMIKELTFPKLDAQDKNACYMNIAISVEDIEFGPGSGNVLGQQAKGFDEQKHWTANNFHFMLDEKKFENACSRVVKIDSFTIKQTIIEHHVGGFKAAIKTPSAIELPTLTFYVPEGDAQPFMDHMATRVGFGGKGNGEVKDGTTSNGHLEAYDNELKPTFRINFFGGDIVSVTPDRSDATSEELKLVKIEMFTEKMTFEYLSQ